MRAATGTAPDFDNGQAAPPASFRRGEIAGDGRRPAPVPVPLPAHERGERANGGAVLTSSFVPLNWPPADWVAGGPSYGARAAIEDRVRL